PPPRDLHSFPTRRSSDLTVSGPELMRVVQHQRAADGIAVIKDGRAARVAKFRYIGMCDRSAIHASRLSGDRANDIEVVNRVIKKDRKSTRLNSSHVEISY